LRSTGFWHAADLGEQVEVLHVPGADLDDVGDLGDELDVTRVEQLRDDRKAGLLAGLGQDLEPLLSESLECVRRAARLECPSAEHRRTGFRDRAGGLERLLAGLDGARACDEPEEAVPDPTAADLDDRRVGRAVSPHEPVGEQLGRPGDVHRP
jgi:hypothetical protein